MRWNTTPPTLVASLGAHAMPVKTNLILIKRALTVLNAFSLARKAFPKTELVRALHVAKMSVQQELAIMIRLAKLSAKDERRNLIPLSLHEAQHKFESFRALASNFAGDYIHGLADDRESIDQLKSLPEQGADYKREFENILARHTTPKKLQDLWIQTIFAANELLVEAIEVTVDDPISGRNNFSRTIVFEPEHKQAAISILAYFGEVVEQKYPNSDVRIRIEQRGNIVTLVVESLSGQIEKFEKELTQYGLVVTGKVPVTEYLSDPKAAMRLQHKIDLAQMELRHTKELLHAERAGYATKIQDLKAEIEFVRQIADKALYEHSQGSSALRAIAVGSDEALRAVLERFAEIIADRPGSAVSELREELSELSKNSPSIIDRISELLIKGSIQGAAGNYLYAALQSLQRLL